MPEEYVAKAVPTTIRANSKVTIKIRDNFYSVEYTEERTIPEGIDVSMDMERQLLFDDVNALVDNQINDILQTFKK